MIGVEPDPGQQGHADHESESRGREHAVAVTGQPAAGAAHVHGSDSRGRGSRQHGQERGQERESDEQADEHAGTGNQAQLAQTDEIGRDEGVETGGCGNGAQHQRAPHSLRSATQRFSVLYALRSYLPVAQAEVNRVVNPEPDVENAERDGDHVEIAHRHCGKCRRAAQTGQ